MHYGLNGSCQPDMLSAFICVPRQTAGGQDLRFPMSVVTGLGAGGRIRSPVSDPGAPDRYGRRRLMSAPVTGMAARDRLRRSLRNESILCASCAKGLGLTRWHKGTKWDRGAASARMMNCK